MQDLPINTPTLRGAVEVINLDHYDGCTTMHDGTLYSVHLEDDFLTVRDVLARMPVYDSEIERTVIIAVHHRLCAQLS